MLPQIVKRTFFTCMQPLMACNAAFYYLFRAPRSGVRYVQLGPGRKNYLPGWINVDANIVTGKSDVWAD